MTLRKRTKAKPRKFPPGYVVPSHSSEVKIRSRSLPKLRDQEFLKARRVGRYFYVSIDDGIIDGPPYVKITLRDARKLRIWIELALLEVGAEP